MAGALPGDLVRARPVREHPRFVEARLVRLLEAGAERRRPACPIQPSCGGCPWMPLADDAQRRFKRSFVVDSLERIGGVPPGAVEDLRFGGRTLGYRNRVELTLGRDRAGRPVVGLHASEPAAGLVDVERCLLQTDPVNRLLATAREFLLAPERSWPTAVPAEPFRLALRVSGSNGTMLVVLWETTRRLPEAGALADWIMERHAEVRGVVRVRRRPGRRGGVRAELLAGEDWLEQRFGEVDFRVPAACFTQVNLDWSSALAGLVRELVGGTAGARVVDLYGGIGVHGFALVEAGAARVWVSEADAAAIECGRDAARRAGITRIRFVHGDAGEFVERRWPERPVDLLVANPPRSGMAGRVVRALGERGVARILLVSCDPPTLARDVRRLGESGYRLRRAIPVDLFPQTPHVETVALLGR